MFISLFSGAIFYDPYHTYNALEHAIYGALHRPIWSLGTVGLVFAVGYSEHGFIYSCLSWKIWIPLSKLVFGAYLVHFPIQLRATAMVTSPHVFNFFDIVSICAIMYTYIFILLIFHSNQDNRYNAKELER